MDDAPFKDAESWLAERGVERDPLRVPLEPPAPSESESAAPPAGGSPEPPESLERPDGDRAESGASEPAGEAPVSAREAARLASASIAEQHRLDQASAEGRPRGRRLDDDVADAVAYVRRSTANAPQSEGRLAGKLRERGYPDAVVEQTMARCREAGIVDDRAMAIALVEEGRRKGHAPLRLRTDLRRRELSDEAIEHALATVADEDPEAAAFALAREKAAGLSGVGAETAFRRVVAHLARRGHPEALARKVAREAVFAARDSERTAGH